MNFIYILPKVLEVLLLERELLLEEIEYFKITNLYTLSLKKFLKKKFYCCTKPHQ